MSTEKNSESRQALFSKLEALLFIYGEPLSYKKIAKALGVKEDEAQEAAVELAKSLEESGRGLSLVRDAETAQLVTHPDFGDLLEQVLKEELKEELSPASLETLSIIVYSAPVSRAELEYVRGVNSSFILRSLLLRGLVKRESDPKRLSAFIYKPSLELFKFLGVSGFEDLPEYAKYSQLIRSLRKEEDAHENQSS